MACAITTQKLGVMVAHVEAGMRSGGLSMPEEINCMVTGAITSYFFTTSEFANNDLRVENVGDERIFFVGNTLIDTLFAGLGRLQPPASWGELRLVLQEYFVLTLHRPSNVDTRDSVTRILNEISEGACRLPVFFPVHSHTAKVLRELDSLPKNVHFVNRNLIWNLTIWPCARKAS